MFLFGRRNGARKWEPLLCSGADILDLVTEYVRIEAPLVRLNIEINGKPHTFGVTSEYDRKKRTFFNAEFYLDEQKFTSLGEFKSSASVDGSKLSEIQRVFVISDEDQGDPRINMLLADREKKYKTI